MSPNNATHEQLVALWSVADASKVAMSFLASFFKRGSHRREAFAAIQALGRALDRLDGLREEAT